MNWFAWRQSRKQFLIFGIILALYAALLIPTGLHFWHGYQQAQVTCAEHPATPSCSDLSGSLFQTTLDQASFHLIPMAVLLLPLILGVFWGAPFLAREYAEGTNALAWTQSVSRRKWLSVKLIWILTATAVTTAGFTAICTWWSKTPNAIGMNRFSAFFGSQGFVPVACSLFVVALAIMFGAWFRKTMVAVGVTFGLFIALVLIVVPNLVRPHYMVPITVTAPMGPDTLDSKIPRNAWQLSRNIVDKNGRVIGDIFPSASPQCQQIIQQAQVPGHADAFKAVPTPGGGDPIDTCLNKAGFHQVAKYQPSYRYWDFQRIETGIFLGAAALAIGATYWLVLKRDA